MLTLNTGKWFASVPTESLAENFAYRLHISATCLGSESARVDVKEKCRDDVLFYINTFGWTYRPKATGTEARVVPFVTWAGQPDFIRSLVEHVDLQKPLAVPKSRDAGASWGCLFVADWLWRFHKYFHVGLSSRIGDLVDSKSPDSLFWKLRQIQRWLPGWMRPEGWVQRVHDTEMHLLNPETESIISGHPTTKDIGVAGRCGLFIFDEYARVPNARGVRDNTKDTADCRVWVSTHTAPGTDFHQICESGVVDTFILHWTQHPDKRRGLYRYHPERPPPHDIEILDKSYKFPDDYPFVRDGTPSGGPFPCLRSPWYDEQCKTRSRVDVRTNLDIDVAGSTSQFFNATLIRRLVAEHARDPEWIGRVWVHGDEAELQGDDIGPLRLWVLQNGRGKFRPSRFLIAADVAAGTGATPSCFTVFDAIARRKVAEFADAHIDPERFAGVMAAVGRMFRDSAGLPARATWDASGPTGKAFTQAFMRLGYENVAYTKGPMGYGGVEAPTERPGFYFTSNDVKAALLFQYHTALEKRSFINPSKEALEECLQFQWVNGQVVHATEKNPLDDSSARLTHADRVFPDALCWMLVDDKKPRDGAGIPQPDDEPEPGSWLWRRRLGEAEDLAREAGDDWKD